MNYGIFCNLKTKILFFSFVCALFSIIFTASSDPILKILRDEKALEIVSSSNVEASKLLHIFISKTKLATIKNFKPTSAKTQRHFLSIAKTMLTIVSIRPCCHLIIEKYIVYCCPISEFLYFDILKRYIRWFSYRQISTIDKQN